MVLKLNRTGNPINRNERNNINENWDNIERDFNNVVNVLSESAYQQVVDSAKLIWQEPVNVFADLTTTYPNAEIGWTAWTRENINGVSRAYRYNGSQWIEQQQFVGDAINEVNNRLESEINRFSKLRESISFNSYFSISRNENTASFQGSCLAGQYIVSAAITSNEDNNTLLYVINKDTLDIVNQINNYSFEHANSLAYNPLNNTIAIAHTINKGIPSNKISIVNATKLADNNPTDFVLRQITLQHQTQAVAFHNNEYYVIAEDQKTVNVYNSDFSLILRSFQLSDNLVVQGIDIYQQLIFVCKWNGSVGLVQVYNLMGEFERQYLIPQDILGEEIESFFSVGNGEFLSSFFGDSNFHYYYKSNVFELNSNFRNLDIENITTRIYVDSSYSGESDGNQSNPFSNLNELSYFIGKYQGNRPLIVYLIGDFSTPLILQGSKVSITIARAPSVSIKPSIPYIDINSCSSVELQNLRVVGYNANNSGRAINSVSSNIFLYGVDVNGESLNPLPSNFSPIYVSYSKLVFDVIPSTISNSRTFAINGLSADIHIMNNITGTNNNTAIRLRSSNLNYSKDYLQLGNNTIIKVDGGFAVNQNYGNWINFTLLNGFELFDPSIPLQYKVTDINGQLFLSIKGAIKVTGPSFTGIVASLSNSDILSMILGNIEFVSLISSGSTARTQQIRWNLNRNGELSISSTTVGQENLVDGQFAQVQLNMYPLN